MRNPRTWVVVIALALVAGGALFALKPKRGTGTSASCSDGFALKGTRCCLASAKGAACTAFDRNDAPHCPSPLVATDRGCDAPDVRVVIDGASLVIGPSDWEAEGRVQARTAKADRFAIDAFEATVGKVFCAACPVPDPARDAALDPLRAASNLSLEEARAYCTARGGRLPSEDEWIVAAAGSKARRYPWGDTGAVCRRAAWGLEKGPCGLGMTGPDTVGTHPDGDSSHGLHDLAGNVAEWVETADAVRVARGGSFSSSLAAELRTWSRLELPNRPGTRDPRVGVRCAYDAFGDAGSPVDAGRGATL